MSALSHLTETIATTPETTVFRLIPNFIFMCIGVNTHTVQKGSNPLRMLEQKPIQMLSLSTQTMFIVQWQMLKLQTCAEPPVCCQSVPECTKQHIALQKFSGETPSDPQWGLCSQARGDGRRERGREVSREGKERQEAPEGREGRRDGKEGRGRDVLLPQTHLAVASYVCVTYVYLFLTWIDSLTYSCAWNISI